jgi:phosphate transport system permease protein
LIFHGILSYIIYFSFLIIFFFLFRKQVCMERTLFSQIKPRYRKYVKYLKDPRTFSDSILHFTIFLLSILTIVVACVVAFSIFKEFFKFLHFVSFWDFITGTYWWPNEYDMIGGEAFGVVPLFVGTIMTSFIAILFATPISIMVAIYTAEYASPKICGKIKFALEILANIPTVVYGFFAAFILSKWLYNVSALFNYSSFSAESALVSGLVVGIMIMPYMITLIDDALRAVPAEIRHTAISLGALKHEIVGRVLMSIITPSIASVIIIALSRAIGETMIVVMAAGLMANMTLSPLEPITTATVQIVTILTGDMEFSSPKTLAAFGIASVLFCITLVLNTISIWISKQFEVKL